MEPLVFNLIILFAETPWYVVKVVPPTTILPNESNLILVTELLNPVP